MSGRHLGLATASRDRSPEAVWSALAPLLAARGRVRVSRDGGRTYRARDERDVTDRLPNQPAAVLTYDRTGCAPVICLDLDASRGGATAVDRDHAALTRLLTRVGARWLSDVSPNGGRHIYVPLAQAAPLHEVRALMASLTARTPTLDPLPMLNLQAGCIRPPGARHRSGGHQVLDQGIGTAVDAIKRPTNPASWRRLLDETRTVVEQQHLAPVGDGDQPDLAGEPRLNGLPGVQGPDTSFTAIARTGEWDQQRYQSPSEARQAVLWAAAASGWGLVDVARRLSDGTWPGLASFYARYPRTHRHTALVRDWRRAVAFEHARREQATNERREDPVRLRTTSPHKTHARTPTTPAPGSTVNREVRVWLAAVDLLTKREDPAVRAVLYALGEAAALTGSLVVEHGNRSLAIATGLDQSTVGRILRRLRSSPADRVLVDLVREAEGVRAHSYVLVVPALLRPACEKKPWRRGRIHAVRPAFRELGLVAAFVYATLEQAREPLSGRTIAQESGVGHTAAYEALGSLMSWGLAERDVEGGWRIGDASPAALAEQFGADEDVARQVAKYRAERLAWWRYLGLVDQEPPVETDQGVIVLDDRRRGPPGEAETVSLLRQVLGAEVIG